MFSGWMQGWLVLVLTACFAGCKAAPVQPDLYAGDAESRIAGIVAASSSQNPDQLKPLLHALEDDDPAVRLFAAEALRRRTGQNFEYRAYAPEAERTETVERWRIFISTHLAEINPETGTPPEDAPQP